MQAVIFSPKPQIVTPQTIRAALELRPGAKFQVISYHGRLELIPVRAMGQARGSLEGTSTKSLREMVGSTLEFLHGPTSYV